MPERCHHYACAKVAKGLGHAVLCGKALVGNEPFAVVLPDVILAEFTADQKTENLAAMIKRFEQTHASQIMVAPVAKKMFPAMVLLTVAMKILAYRKMQ